MASESANSHKFGLRYEDMSESELEYYREFWQEPAPQAGNAGYQLSAYETVKARVRMATGLSFTLMLFGILLTVVALIAESLIFTVLCGLIVVLALGLLVAVRRRLFKSLRVPGQAPIQKNKKAKLFWIPHLLVVAGVIAGVISYLVIPEIFAGAEPNLLRSHILMWNEISLLFLLGAALFYGLLILAIYTPEDTDDSIIRPTDYAERQMEKDIAKGRGKDDQDFYDSDWIRGR